jgi:hypothetical protein
MDTPRWALQPFHLVMFHQEQPEQQSNSGHGKHSMPIPYSKIFQQNPKQHLAFLLTYIAHKAKVPYCFLPIQWPGLVRLAFTLPPDVTFSQPEAFPALLISHRTGFLGLVRRPPKRT